MSEDDHNADDQPWLGFEHWSEVLADHNLLPYRIASCPVASGHGLVQQHHCGRVPSVACVEVSAAKDGYLESSEVPW